MPGPAGRRLQGAVAQRVLATAGHDLHGHAALKDLPVLEAVYLRLLRVDQLLPEGLVLLLAHGAVDIVGRALVIAGGEIRALHVNALKAHKRGGGVVEMQRLVLFAPELRQLRREGVGRQRAGGDDDLPGWDLRHLAGDDGDVRVALH